MGLWSVPRLGAAGRRVRLWGPWSRNRFWRLGDEVDEDLEDDSPGPPQPAQPLGRLESVDAAAREGGAEADGGRISGAECPPARQGLRDGRESGVGTTPGGEYVEFEVRWSGA